MSAPIKVQPKLFYGWWIVAASFILIFLYGGAGFYSFSIFIQPLENAFGWSRSQISVAISIYLLVHGISAPAVGYLIERFEPKTIITVFAGISGLAFILVSFTQSLWYFYTSYVLLSIGTTGIGYIPLSTILSRWFIRKRGTAIGIAMLGLAVGGMIMAPLVGAIVSFFSWRISFVVLGVMVWVIGIPISLLVIKKHPAEMGLLADGEFPENSITSQTNNRKEISLPISMDGWPLQPALRTKAFWGITTAFTLGSLALMGVLQHQVPLITDKGISIAVAASALGLTSGLGGLGKLSFGKITEVIPFRYVGMLCYGLQAISILVLFYAQSMATVWIYVIFFGFSMGGASLLLALGVSSYFGLASLGVIMGIISFSQSIGYASGAVISGLIYDTFGSYEKALVLYFIIYVCAMLAMYLAGNPKQYEEAS